MQIKTITQNIRTKLNQWLETITDESLKKLVKDNILVSGGSITSMLLNEPVNDYDVYINDMDVLIKLVKYYTNGFNVQIFDGRLKESLLKSLSDEYHCENIKELDGIRAISIRNLKENQVKLFFDNDKGGSRVNENIDEEKLNYTPVFFSPNAISLSNDLQIITRFHGDNEEIHKTFDYIHATNYFTFKEGLVTNKEALESIITKQLKYQGSLYPLTSIIRMKKFIKRGWNINAGEILKIMFQISELDLKNPDVLEDQLIGVDVAYFGTLIAILRGTPSNALTSKYLNSIIDKVFDSYDE